MEALVTWREAALHDMQSLVSSRPVSPQPLSEDESVKSEDELDSARRFKRTVTDSSVSMVDGATKDPRTPSSSSWTRWWSRSRRAEGARPDIGHTASDPSAVAQVRSCQLLFTSILTINAEQIDGDGDIDSGCGSYTPNSNFSVCSACACVSE